MGRKRRTISRELKLKVAVEALKNETTVQELATKYQITPSMVSNWKKGLETGDLSLLGEDKETKKLKEDLKAAKESIEFLTTAYGKSQITIELLKKNLSL